MTLAPEISSLLFVDISSKDSWIETYFLLDCPKTKKITKSNVGTKAINAKPIFQSRINENTKEPSIIAGLLKTKRIKNKMACWI